MDDFDDGVPVEIEKQKLGFPPFPEPPYLAQDELRVRRLYLIGLLASSFYSGFAGVAQAI
jgi:hypothetical protein